MGEQIAGGWQMPGIGRGLRVGLFVPWSRPNGSNNFFVYLIRVESCCLYSVALGSVLCCPK